MSNPFDRLGDENVDWCYDIQEGQENSPTNTNNKTTSNNNDNINMRIKKNNPFDSDDNDTSERVGETLSSQMVPGREVRRSNSRRLSTLRKHSSRKVANKKKGGNGERTNPFEADEEDLSLISDRGAPQDSGEGGDTTDAPKIQEIHEARQVRRKKTMVIGVSTLIVLIVIALGVTVPMLLTNDDSSADGVQDGNSGGGVSNEKDEEKSDMNDGMDDGKDGQHGEHTPNDDLDIIDGYDDEYNDEPVTSWARLSRTFDDPSILDGYRGTKGCSHFQSDIEKAIRLMADVVIDRHAQIYYNQMKFDEFTPRGGQQLPIGPDLFDGDIMVLEDAGVAQSPTMDAIPTADSSTSDKTASGENSYGTNNQVDGVDEADYVKSDGDFVYAGYGNELVVWEAKSGKEISRTTLPFSDEDGISICKKDDTGGVSPMMPSIPTDANNSMQNSIALSSACYLNPYGSKMSIESLVLHEDRIVVIARAPEMILNVQDEPPEKSYVSQQVVLDVGKSKRILSGHRSTRVFVYDASQLQYYGQDVDTDTEEPSSVTDLKLLAQKDLNGMYKSARLIGPDVHIVTTSRIDTTMFVTETSPWNIESKYEEVSQEEYLEIAQNITNRMVPKFAKKLISEVLQSDVMGTGNHLTKDALTNADECKFLKKIALMLKPSSKMNNEDNSAPSFTTSNVLQTYTQITSFNIPSAGSDVSESRRRRQMIEIGSYFGGPPIEREDDDRPQFVSSFPVSGDDSDVIDVKGYIHASKTGIFLPVTSYTSNMYASKDVVVITGEAYRQTDEGQWHECTAVYTFSLLDDDGHPYTKAISIGEVPGSLLNQFSIDHRLHDDGKHYLRIATTTWAKYSFDEGSKLWKENSESSSQVSVLHIPSGDDDLTTMELVGQISGLGMGERIYAVRFLGKKGFVVTFKQVDPFYTLDLSDPKNPQLAGELKIPGFSNYLHPIEDDNFILAVGQDANTTTGVTLGLQIAVFNVTNLSDPTQIQKYVEEQTSSSSHAQHDHKAFRYLDESKVLILPSSHSKYNPMSGRNQIFDGFITYDIDVFIKIGIKKRFEISHVNDMQTCWSSSYMHPRSMVFDGLLTTMKGHTVMSHDLATEDHQWTLNLDDGKDYDCFSWWAK